MSVPPDRAPELSALSALDARSREIFRRIVESYLAIGEPVGSRSLSRQLPMALSPASIRNVMQDLEELGLIYAPHTSAGRLPTQVGLRFYVDALLEFGGLADEERTRIARQAREAAEGGYENALTRTTTLLSDLSRGAGLVLTTKDDVRLRHIEFVRGQANLIGPSNETQELERIRLLFADLETQTDVIDLLHRAENGEGVKIFIGSENKLFSLSGSSMIAAPLRGADQRIAGVTRPGDRYRDTGRGLVVGPRDHVDRRVALRFGRAARVGLHDDRVADEGVLGDRGRELGAELAVAQVQ